MMSISVGNPQTPQMGINGTPTGGTSGLVVNEQMQSLGMDISNNLMPWDPLDMGDETDYEGSFTINGVSTPAQVGTENADLEASYHSGSRPETHVNL
jgi:hypothetical protein